MSAPLGSKSTEGPSDLSLLAEKLGREAAVAARAAGGAVELCPSSAHEVARALAVRSALGRDAQRVRISLAAFNRIGEVDPVACSIRAGGSAPVGEVERRLQSAGLTLGALSPRARSLSVREWLTGPYAGLRPVPGNRLETAALSATVALEGGGVYRSLPSPRSAIGPMIDALLLGAGDQAGLLVEATLRAVPRAQVQQVVHAGVERAEEVVALIRSALQRDVALVEVQVGRKARGFAVDLTLASPGFRARRDRAALEALVAGRGELKTMRRVYERELAFEGELAWDRLSFAVAHSGPLALYRLARESAVVAAQQPVKGALPLDAPAAPLPEPLRSALRARASAAPAGADQEP